MSIFRLKVIIEDGLLRGIVIKAITNNISYEWAVPTLPQNILSKIFIAEQLPGKYIWRMSGNIYITGS